jgi:hypothetical protein
MNWFLSSFLGAALLAGIVSVFAWQHRREAGMRWLALMLLAAAEWSVGYALELSLGGPSRKNPFC